MILNKIKDNRFYIMLSLIACCAGLAHIGISFQVVLYALVICAPILLDDTKTISVYVFSACFMACFGPSGFLIALNVSLLLIETKKIVMAIKTKDENFKNIKTILFIWVSILIVFTLYSLLYNKFKVYRMGMFLDFVQCCFTFYLIHNKVNLKHILLIMAMGIATSVVMASGFQLMDIKSTFIAGKLGKRFGAFFNNVNALSVFCTTCASCVVALILNNCLEFKKYCWLPFAVSCMGFLSMSKIFLLLTILLYCLWYGISFIKSNNRKRYIWYSIIIVISLALILIVCKNYISQILDRFTSNAFSSKIDAVTTGRTPIWKAYIKRWLKSPITFLFGNGYTAQKIASNNYEHSIYLAFMFQFGLIGSSIIIGTLVYSIKKAGFSKNISNYIPVGLLLINGLVSNLSGVLCPCLTWLLAFCIIVNKPNQAQQNLCLLDKTQGEDNDK